MKRTIVKIAFFFCVGTSVSAIVIILWYFINQQMMDYQTDYYVYMAAYVTAFRWECYMFLLLLISVPSAVFSDIYLKCNPKG